MKKDKEAVAKEMFNKLRKHIGKEVSYTAWWYGNKEEGTDILREVNDFCNVSIGAYSIPFVGYGSAISKIISKDGEILYSNPYIEYGYDRRDDREIFSAKRVIFGDKIDCPVKIDIPVSLFIW